MVNRPKSWGATAGPLRTRAGSSAGHAGMAVADNGGRARGKADQGDGFKNMNETRRQVKISEHENTSTTNQVELVAYKLTRCGGGKAQKTQLAMKGGFSAHPSDTEKHAALGCGYPQPAFNTPPIRCNMLMHANVFVCLHWRKENGDMSLPGKSCERAMRRPL